MCYSCEKSRCRENCYAGGSLKLVDVATGVAVFVGKADDFESCSRQRTYQMDFLSAWVD